MATVIPLRRPSGTSSAAYRRDVAERAYLMARLMHQETPIPETFLIVSAVKYARDQARKEAEAGTPPTGAA